MTYRILSLVVLGAFPALGECGVSLIVSLNPLVGYQDAVSEPALVGTWQATDGNDRLVVRATGPAEHEIVFPRDDPKDDKSYEMRLWCRVLSPVHVVLAARANLLAKQQAQLQSYEFAC